MSLGSPMNLPLVSSQLGVIVKVLVTGLAVKLRVHCVFLVIVAVVEGDPGEVELAVRAVRLLRHHAVHALVVPVQGRGVYEELVAECATTVHILAVSFVQMSTVRRLSCS